MPYRIAQGPLGTRALDALVDDPNACDLTMVRLKQLPPEVLARIGIPSSPELKGLEAWVAEEVANRYLGVGISPREFARIEGKLWDAWNQRLGTQLARVLRREAVIFSAHQPGLAFLGPEVMDPG